MQKYPFRALVLPVFSLLMMLSLTALACNLTSNDNQPTQVGPLRAMTAQIISPSANTAFPVGQPITVQAKVTDPDGTGVTRVELRANNIVVDQKPSLNAAGDKDLTINLTWDAPSAPGNVVLSVIPYRGATRGTTANAQILVVDSNIATTQATVAGGSGGPTAVFTVVPTYNPNCRARIDANRLNFRSSPEVTEDNLLGYFVIGDEAPMLARLSDNSWYQVRAIVSTQTGWIAGSYTTLLGNCSSIPTTSFTTPTPPPTPTLAPSQAPSKPNIVALQPSGLSSLPAGLDGTASATYTFTIQNTGGQATGAFVVVISLPDGNQVTENITNLTPGQSLSFPSGGLTVTFTSPGLHRITYAADAQFQVDESNEGDNLQFIDVQVIAIQ